MHSNVSRTQGSLMPSFYPYRDDAIEVFGGEGNYVETNYGRLLDITAGYWNVILGQKHPRLMKVLTDPKNHFVMDLYDDFYMPAIEYAEALKARTGFSKVGYATSGSGAVDEALRFAWQAQKRSGRQREIVVCLKGSYHGDTAECQRVSGFEYGKWLPELGYRRVLKEPYMISSEKELTGLASQLEEKIHDEGLQDRITAFIYEPIMGVRGAVELPRTYIEAIQEICRKYNILMIADEISTGMGRTGHLFAYERTGVKPDIMCLGKGISNGHHALSAVLYSEEVYQDVESSQEEDFGKYNRGNASAGLPLACIIAKEVLDIVENDITLDEIRRKGEHAKSDFERLRRHPAVRDIRVYGLMGAIDLQNSQIANQVRKELLQRGIKIKEEGRMLMFMPPYTITDGEIDRFACSLDESLRRMSLSRD